MNIKQFEPQSQLAETLLRHERLESPDDSATA